MQKPSFNKVISFIGLTFIYFTVTCVPFVIMIYIIDYINKRHLLIFFFAYYYHIRTFTNYLVKKYKEIN
jgi:hypothetical protein